LRWRKHTQNAFVHSSTRAKEAPEVVCLTDEETYSSNSACAEQFLNKCKNTEAETTALSSETIEALEAKKAKEALEAKEAKEAKEAIEKT
jgi:hypothetical protein